MTGLAGAAIATAALIGVLGAVAVAWRRPTLGLAIFAVGLALHNIVLMVLLNAKTPEPIVRFVQAWKEAVLLVLVLRVLRMAMDLGGLAFLTDQLRRWRASPAGLRVLDLLACAFAALIVVYWAAPISSSDGATPTLAQRLVSLRMYGLMPALYLLGRIWVASSPGEMRVVVGIVVGVAVAVALFGWVELWFVPTRNWVNWGVVSFNSLLGFSYSGPGGLPENFFQNTTSGLGLRRMVSTYLSPLGVAYTGLLVIPLVFSALQDRARGLAWVALLLVASSLAFSLTRLALLALVPEAIALAIIFRRRAVVAAAICVTAVVASAFLLYPNYGPVVSFDLTDVRPPAGLALVRSVAGLAPERADRPPSTLSTYPPTASDRAASPSPSPTEGPVAGTEPSPIGNLAADIVARLVSGRDESIRVHVQELRDGLAFVVEHPLGIGLGASAPRFGPAIGPGESAFFQIGAEAGVLGLILFSALYAGVILISLVGLTRFAHRDLRDSFWAVAAVGGLALSPIVLTSQVWGNFSVTFFYWWVAGASVSLFVARRRRGGSEIRLTCPRPAGDAQCETSLTGLQA